MNIELKTRMQNYKRTQSSSIDLSGLELKEFPEELREFSQLS